MDRTRTIRGVLLLTLLAGPARAADVWNVGGPGADFPDLVSAVAAAGDGDVLRVAPGTYGFFQVNGKGLAIVAADPDQGFTVVGAIRVQSTSTAQHVLLSGATVEGDASDALIVNQCQGPVRVQDAQLQGDHGYTTFALPSFHPDAWDAVRVLGSVDVVLVDCVLQGGSGGGVVNWNAQGPCGNAGHGLRAEGSTVVLDGCTAHGGWGGSCFDSAEYEGGQGGSGVFLTGSSAVVRGCDLVGGPGGHGCDAYGLNFGGPGGGGGHGLRAEGGSMLVTLDDSLLPGDGGSAGIGSGLDPGFDGLPLSLWQSSHTPLGGAARELSVPALVHEGDPVPFVYHGRPGDDVWLALSLTAGHQVQPAWNGALLLGSPWISQRRPMGVLGATGTTTFWIPAPQAPLLGATTWYVQALFVSSGGTLVLSNTRVLVSLDAGV